MQIAIMVYPGFTALRQWARQFYPTTPPSEQPHLIQKGR